MKKAMIIMLAVLLAGTALIASPAVAAESEMYYTNAQIIKIFPHQLGYYIIYKRTKLKTGEAFIPKEWFDRRNSKAVMNRFTGDIAPYFSYMTKNGEFDHIRIYVPEDIFHPVWGTLQSGAKYNDKFNVETFEMQY